MYVCLFFVVLFFSFFKNKVFSCILFRVKIGWALWELLVFKPAAAVMTLGMYSLNNFKP